MKIFIAGHNGLVGSAIRRRLEKEDVSLLFASRDQLDLLKQDQVNLFLEANKPDVVIDAAAKVGGIHANNVYPAEFIYQNLQIRLTRNGKAIHLFNPFSASTQKMILFTKTFKYKTT